MYTPIPPAFAIAIAILDSVTVSIAEDKNGTFKFIFLVSLMKYLSRTAIHQNILELVIHRQRLKTLLLFPYKLINNF